MRVVGHRECPVVQSRVVGCLEDALRAVAEGRDGVSALFETCIRRRGWYGLREVWAA